MVDLLPCPFCGCADIEIHGMPGIMNAESYAVCASCYGGEKISIWNRRAISAADTERLDWLSDPDNRIGNVQLPKEAVLLNPYCLRAAIDYAMNMDKTDE